MGKASSAKKVARAARAGGNRRPGQRRQLGFPVLIAVVVIAGISLVTFARSTREVNAAPLSQANPDFDHWHAAYSVSDCGSFLYDGAEGGPFFSDFLQDPQGIHTHQDGVFHIHPFLDSAGGTNARLKIWLEDVNLQLTDTTATFPDGTVWDEATKRCGEGDDAEPGQIVVARWNSAQAAADGERPNEIVTEDFGDLRFRNNLEAYTFAFVPESQLEDIPVRPGIMETLSNLSDVPPDQNIDVSSTTSPDGSSTTTSPAGEPSDASTTTTVAGESTTTTAG